MASYLKSALLIALALFLFVAVYFYFTCPWPTLLARLPWTGFVSVVGGLVLAAIPRLSDAFWRWAGFGDNQPPLG